MHADALAHETAANPLLVAPAGCGLPCTDHAVPFQNSVSGTVRDRRFVNEPTATQDDAPVHETPLSPANDPPVGVGTDTTAQDDPSHDSANGQFRKLLSLYDPTATQFMASAQETALS
jgi:hypothetical protein